MPLDRELADLAARQHGLVTRQQALEAGFSARMIEARLGRGWWKRVERGVFLVGGAPFTWHTRVLAACLAAGPGALASHRSAAALWHFDGWRTGPPELVIPSDRRLRRADVRVHHSTYLPTDERTVRAGVPVTTVTRTLLDLGAVVSAEAVGHAVDDARRRRLCDWADLYATLVRHARRGRNGVGALRAALDVRFGEQHVPDSRFERVVERLLVDAGLPPPVSQHQVVDGTGRFVARVDLAYPALAIAIELDGRHHVTEAGFEADRPRQNRLELLGWLVLRYTWRFAVDHPDRVCAEVATAIANRRRATVPASNS